MSEIEQQQTTQIVEQQQEPVVEQPKEEIQQPTVEEPQEKKEEEKEEKTTIKIMVFNNHGTVHFHCEKLEIPQMNTEAATNEEQPQEAPVEEPKKEEPVIIDPVYVVQVPINETPEEKIKTKLNLQQKHLDKFKQWTQKKEFKVIYENDEVHYAKDFFEKVKGMKDIMILIETSTNMLFGGYFPEMPSKQKEVTKYHPKHFVFTVRNPFVIPPTMFRPRTQNNHLMTIMDDNDLVNIFENNAFVIKNDTTSKINIRFSSTYQDTTMKGETLFTGREKVFTVKNLVALQWE